MATSGLNSPALRIFRVVRLLRLSKLLRMLKSHPSLFLIIKSLESSIHTLMWSFVLILFVQVGSGLLLSNLLQTYLNDDSVDVDDRIAVFQYFGTFERTIVTMFEIAMANWVPSCRLLMKNLSTWFGIFYIVYRCMICFCIVRVVAAVFVTETKRIADADLELTARKRHMAKKEFLGHLSELFVELDHNGDGMLTRSEFDCLMEDETLAFFFNELDIPTKDLQGLFDMLDDGDGNIYLKEFFAGVQRVRGPARSIDIVTVLMSVRDISKQMESVMQGVAHLEGRPKSIPHQHQHRKMGWLGLDEPCERVKGA
eukprot:gnl/TRDRNA2_/TRDRNA2_174121_c1_seq9.p1 gnl/TRDRNA2_/TRDRNA2_174121_c1~~gnl/TRDRNA2_/TRDRNA2_174121_c1_seq9.p1  ORF type:complete len:347 (+),score=30.31 gnl/TRDRNA2_/TRDRNA2_174121_c1_seq9:107-1042(+)